MRVCVFRDGMNTTFLEQNYECEFNFYFEFRIWNLNLNLYTECGSWNA